MKMAENTKKDASGMEAALRAYVVGAGLAGCEAALFLASRGVEVMLFECKSFKPTPAQSSVDFAELVCSNSLKAESVSNACGLMKREMQMLGSVLVESAYANRVPAGGALAVDRDGFSSYITRRIKSEKNITVCEREITELDFDAPVIIATGPLTTPELAAAIMEKTLHSNAGGNLSFFDAAAPIVEFEGVDMKSAFFESRYGKGDGGDYLNCPLNKEEYLALRDFLIEAPKADVHGFDKDMSVFEGCLPIEVLAARGEDAMRYGPLKPVGLRLQDGSRPYAVIQLRRDNFSGTLYNMVGFQTRLTFAAQKQMMTLIPALKNAVIARYGVMHRNIYVNAPAVLDHDFSMLCDHNVYIAGQLSGVEGYVESAASGLIAAASVYKKLCGETLAPLPATTSIGALIAYITDRSIKSLQPMNANFGIFPPLEKKIRNKRDRYDGYAERALSDMEAWIISQDIKM